MDDKVPGAAWTQGLAPPFQKLTKEPCVNVAKLVHAGEQALDHFRLQLQLFQHPSAKEAGHNLQGPHMVQLCLDQLYDTEGHLALLYSTSGTTHGALRGCLRDTSLSFLAVDYFRARVLRAREVGFLVPSWTWQRQKED